MKKVFMSEKGEGSYIHTLHDVLLSAIFKILFNKRRNKPVHGKSHPHGRGAPFDWCYQEQLPFARRWCPYILYTTYLASTRAHEVVGALWQHFAVLAELVMWQQYNVKIRETHSQSKFREFLKGKPAFKTVKADWPRKQAPSKDQKKDVIRV